MAISASTATTIAAVTGVLGAATGAAGMIQSGQAASRQAKFQSAALQQQADRERQAAEVEASDFRRRQSRLMATRRALMGASGVESGTGSPLLASEDFSAESELQALRILAGGGTRASRLEQEGELTRARGRAARQSGFARGGALLLDGAGRGVRRFEE